MPYFPLQQQKRKAVKKNPNGFGDFIALIWSSHWNTQRVISWIGILREFEYGINAQYQSGQPEDQVKSLLSMVGSTFPIFWLKNSFRVLLFVLEFLRQCYDRFLKNLYATQLYFSWLESSIACSW